MFKLTFKRLNDSIKLCFRLTGRPAHVPRAPLLSLSESEKKRISSMISVDELEYVCMESPAGGQPTGDKQNLAANCQFSFFRFFCSLKCLAKFSPSIYTFLNSALQAYTTVVN